MRTFQLKTGEPRNLVCVPAVIFVTVFIISCSKPPDDEYGWREPTKSELQDIKNAMKDSSLVDPFSVELKDLYIKESTIHFHACGQLNAKNRMGAYVGWKHFYTQKLKGSTDKYDWGMLEINVPGSYSVGYLRKECKSSPMFRYYDNEGLDSIIVMEELGLEEGK